MLNLEKVGEKITNLRKQNDLKQNELADALYVSHQAVSKWENGKSIPSIEILYNLTQLFNVSVDYLLNDIEIEEDDYEAKLRNYPREAIIKNILLSKQVNEELAKSFYLLTRDERKQIINQIIRNKLDVDVEEIWHVFSPDEKQYILSIIQSNKMNYDLSKLYFQLSAVEQRTIKSHMNKGIKQVYLTHEKRR